MESIIWNNPSTNRRPDENAASEHTKCAFFVCREEEEEEELKRNGTTTNECLCVKALRKERKNGRLKANHHSLHSNREFTSIKSKLLVRRNERNGITLSGEMRSSFSMHRTQSHMSLTPMRRQSLNFAIDELNEKTNESQIKNQQSKNSAKSKTDLKLHLVKMPKVKMPNNKCQRYKNDFR
uniref:Uncharacterized protein n=1 Tax=Globodera rostochiensis TaxID=31243 RepID=A0A914HF31_GLORO